MIQNGKLGLIIPLHLLSLESKQRHQERRKKDTLFIPFHKETAWTRLGNLALLSFRYIF